MPARGRRATPLGDGVEAAQGRYSTAPRGPDAARLAMANIASQKKRILRAERERLENRQHTSAIKTYFRRLETAVAEGDAEKVATEHRTLVSLIDKAVKTGALHRNTGARKKSRAARIVRAAATSSPPRPRSTGYAVIAPIARSASVSASSAEPPRSVELEVGERGDRAPQRRGVGARDVGDERRRRLRRHPQLAADVLRCGTALELRARHAERLAQAPRDPVGERLDALALRAQRAGRCDVARRACRARRPRRRASRPCARRCARPARRRRRRRGARPARTRAPASRARARGAPGACRRARRARVPRQVSSVRSSSRALRDRPVGQVPLLDRDLGATSPPAARTARVQRRRRLARPSSRAKNAIVVFGSVAASAGARCLVTSASSSARRRRR